MEPWLYSRSHDETRIYTDLPLKECMKIKRERKPQRPTEHSVLKHTPGLYEISYNTHYIRIDEKWFNSYHALDKNSR